VGSNPGTVYWMDVAITLNEKLKIKVAKWGTPKIFLFSCICSKCDDCLPTIWKSTSSKILLLALRHSITCLPEKSEWSK
jgi:hypothetical protein